MSDSGLPAGWEVRHSHSRNHPYYFNNSTNESRWNAPEGTNLEKLAIHIKASGATGHSGTDGGGAPQDGKVRAAHLLVKHRDSRRPSSWRDPVITRSKEEARAILEGYEGRIHVGPITLGELAMTESDCSSAKKHGDLGYFGRGEMQKEFEDVAFALKPGEMSHIVESPSGLHLIERLA